MSERRSPGPVTGFTLWRWTASLVLSAAAIALFALAVLTWPQVAENADVRRALQEDGTRTTATVTELGFTRPDGTALYVWARMGSGEVYSVDLRGSSVRVTRSGGIVDVVVQPDLHAALPPDVVARPVWTAYLQGRLLWPLAGTVLAFAALVAVLRP